jgi:hypothetical protein
LVPNIQIYTEYLPNINQIHPEYALNIHSWNLNDRIQILNIFVPKKHNIYIKILIFWVMIFEYSNNQTYLSYTAIFLLPPCQVLFHCNKAAHVFFSVSGLRSQVLLNMSSLSFLGFINSCWVKLEYLFPLSLKTQLQVVTILL